MGNLAKISPPGNYFTLLCDFIVAEGSCQTYVAKLFPRHSQYLAHTDSHNQRAVSAVLSLRRPTYLRCRFPVSVSDFRGFAACGFGLSPYLGKPPHARKYPLVNLVPRVLSNPPYGRAGRREPWERGCPLISTAHDKRL